MNIYWNTVRPGPRLAGPAVMAGLLLAGLASGLRGQVGGGGDVEVVLEGVEWRPQQPGKGKWCWAAATEMVIEYLRARDGSPVDVRQCDLANEYFWAELVDEDGDELDCCQGAPDEKCDRVAWPDWATFDNHGYTVTVRKPAANVTDTFLTWPEIRDQIETNRTPVMFAWAYDGPDHLEHERRGHMVVMVGFRERADGRKEIFHLDPLSRPEYGEALESITYEQYVNGPHGNWWHWRSYFDIKPKDSGDL